MRLGLLAMLSLATSTAPAAKPGAALDTKVVMPAFVVHFGSALFVEPPACDCGPAIPPERYAKLPGSPHYHAASLRGLSPAQRGGRYSLVDRDSGAAGGTCQMEQALSVKTDIKPGKIAPTDAQASGVMSCDWDEVPWIALRCSDANGVFERNSDGLTNYWLVPEGTRAPRVFREVSNPNISIDALSAASQAVPAMRAYLDREMAEVKSGGAEEDDWHRGCRPIRIAPPTVRFFQTGSRFIALVELAVQVHVRNPREPSAQCGPLMRPAKGVAFEVQGSVFHPLQTSSPEVLSPPLGRDTLVEMPDRGLARMGFFRDEHDTLVSVNLRWLQFHKPSWNISKVNVSPYCRELEMDD